MIHAQPKVNPTKATDANTDADYPKGLPSTGSYKVGRFHACGRLLFVLVKVATVALVLALTACSGGSGGGGSGSGASSDQTFLRMATQDGRLATEDHATLISLGHEACDLLRDYHGDTAQVDTFFVTSAGKGGADTFSPSVMQNLRAAAAAAYCPNYR